MSSWILNLLFELTFPTFNGVRLDRCQVRLAVGIQLIQEVTWQQNIFDNAATLGSSFHAVNDEFSMLQRGLCRPKMEATKIVTWMCTYEKRHARYAQEKHFDMSWMSWVFWKRWIEKDEELDAGPSLASRGGQGSQRKSEQQYLRSTIAK